MLMRSIIRLALCLPLASSQCDTAWNRQPNLEPPGGGGWRGSTIGKDSDNLGGLYSENMDPTDWEAKYG